MNYQMGGPVLKGTFISKRTGREVIVRDTIQMDDHMVVMLKDGETVPINDFYNEYYQMSEEEYDINGNIIGKGEIKESSTSNLNPNLIFSDLESYSTVAGDPEPAVIRINEPVKTDIVSSGQQMVEKLLKKVNKPSIKVEFEWDDYPSQQIAMLKDFYDVTDDDIVAAIIKEHLHADFIKNECVSQISKYISI